jgi:hypothetical protein
MTIAVTALASQYRFRPLATVTWIVSSGPTVAASGRRIVLFVESVGKHFERALVGSAYGL